jgi:glycosyltransferase involved in cell wall biosynthesis
VPDRARVLAVGHGGTNGGFARVLREVLTPLVDQHDVLHLAIGAPPPAGVPYRSLRCPSRDVYGLASLPEALTTHRPDVVLLLHDPWILPAYLRCVAQEWPRARTVAYCPVDGPLLAAGLGRLLTMVDRLVAYTEFGRWQLAQAAARALGGKPGHWARRVDVIPHGVDRSTFHPWKDRPAARRALRGWLDLGPDDFVVLNANRNQPRKDITATIDGFARFARGKPATARLMLHMQPVAAGCDVHAVARRFQVAHRLALPPVRRHPEISDARLNVVYNAADVGINTAAGEGWGLVSFEHAAAGTAQLVPDHGAPRELWRKHAELLACGPPRARRPPLVADRPVDPAAVAEALERVYRSETYRSRLAALALARTAAPDLQWPRIARSWLALIEGVLATRPTGTQPPTQT